MSTITRCAPHATAAALLMLGAGLAAAAAADSPALEGRYGMTAMGGCLSSPQGFYPNRVAIEPSSANSLVNRGILVFRRDGTGSANIVQTQLNLPPAAPATYSGSSEITFEFTHRMGPGGSMTVEMLLDTYVATYLTGPSAGLRAGFVTTSPWPTTWVWSGTHSEDRKTLLLNNGDTPSRLRFSSGTEVTVVCQLARVLTRLTP